MDENKRPTGLIRNNKITPNQPATNPQPQKSKTKKAVAKNQDSNIKVSSQTKEQIELLIKLTDHKFAYQMIEAMIDNYVDTALDPDKKRAFKTLANL